MLPETRATAGAASGPLSAESAAGGWGVRLGLAAVLVAWCVRRIGDFDIWWHLAYGRLILARGAVPRVDEFSFTAAGAGRVDPEWLFQAIVAALHAVGGTAALVLAKTALLLAVAWLVLRFVERELALRAVPAVALVAPFLLAGRWRFIERPELATIALAAVLVATLLRRRERAPATLALLWVPLLFALWANLHAGIIVGAGVLALFALGRSLEPWLARRGAAPPALGRPSAAQGWGLLALSLLASLANPFGWRVWKVPFELTALHEAGVFRNLEWALPRWPAHWLFFATLLATAAALLTRRRRPDLAALLPLLLLAALALRYVRNLGLWGCLAPLLLAAALAERDGQGAVARTLSGALARVRPALATAVLLGLAAAFLAGDQPFPRGVTIDAQRLPVAAVDRLEELQPQGQLLNTHAFGGYLIWRRAPEHRVFLDGRDDLYADFRRRLGRAVLDSRLWFPLLDELEIGATLLGYEQAGTEVRQVDAAGRVTGTIRQPWSVTYFPPDEWALVYFDDVAMIHLRRTPAHAERIAREGLDALFPEDPDYQRWMVASGAVPREAAEAQLARVLARDPLGRRAAALRDALAEVRNP